MVAGQLAGLDGVFVPSGSRSGSHAATKAPAGPGGQDTAAWLLHPPGFTHWSLVHSYFKAERSKTELERNYNFHPVPCYCLLQSCTNVGLSGSGPTSPHWSQLRTYLQVTRGKTQVVAAPGHLPWPLLGATGTSCSHGRGHCCTLTMHSRFYCRSTYSF